MSASCIDRLLLLGRLRVRLRLGEELLDERLFVTAYDRQHMPSTARVAPTRSWRRTPGRPRGRTASASTGRSRGSTRARRTRQRCRAPGARSGSSCLPVSVPRPRTRATYRRSCRTSWLGEQYGRRPTQPDDAVLACSRPSLASPHWAAAVSAPGLQGVEARAGVVQDDARPGGRWAARAAAPA